MPSPFPGMDPYLEDPHGWLGVRLGLLTTISYEISRQTTPHFFASIRERRYLVRAEEVARQVLALEPQLFDYKSDGTPIAIGFTDEETRDRYIEIHDKHYREIVTTLELLSPTTKFAGSTNRRKFLAHRSEVMASTRNWMELDLLRAGERPSDLDIRSNYYVMLKRSNRSEPYEVWTFGLQEQLPTITVPLRPPFQDVSINLQAIFDEVYERVYYAISTDYSRPVPSPPLRPDDANWVAARVREWQEVRSGLGSA